ncbi:MAG: transposase, partial [Ketobacter sp.]|nr:transposase [Ketobacter sp.]
MSSTLHTTESLSQNPDEMRVALEQLKHFRQQLYSSLAYRGDTIMDLLDALSSNTTAKSVVELSLNPLFRRGYGSVYDGIQQFSQSVGVESVVDERRAQEQQLMQLIASYLPTPQQQRYWLIGVDVTPAPRGFADTLTDRSYVYYPNTIASNKPVTIGHQYSALVLFPEKLHASAPPCIVPLSLRRVTTQETKRSVGVQQVDLLLNDQTLPFHQQLCVQVVDSEYSVVSYLGEMTEHENLVTIARVRSNRVFYQMPPPRPAFPSIGHPTWYGERFDLKDSDTWKEPDEAIQTTYTNHLGRIYKVQLECWHDLLMSGTREYPMHQHPFTLIRARVFNEANEQVFQRPLWLLVMGQRRNELSLTEGWKGYRRRYDVEHFFRFGKQRLLMTAYQTPEVQHEENWWQLAQLAYVQLWLARCLTEAMPRPWERYLPQFQTQTKNQEASPSMVQRDFGRIIQEIGTPAKAPKPRGKSPG